MPAHQSMSKQLSKTKPSPEDSKGNPQAAGLSVPKAAQKWRGGGRTGDFYQDSEAMHHQGCPLERPLQSHSITTQHVAGGGKTSQETKLVVKNTHCHLAPA